VATRARHPDVFPREWEGCLGIVIEFSVRPGDRVVARRADRWSKPCLRVRRIGRSVVLVHVAAAASCRRIGVISADVALRALQIGVRVGQREKLCMIEIRVAPARRRVARSAGRCCKPGLRMRRIVSAVVFLHMTRSAVCRRAGELTVDMALIARHSVVLRDQREFGGRVVVKSRIQPARRVVAGRAERGCETSLRVGRVVRGVVILRVAAVAIRRCAFEFPADVASRAFQSCVHACQGEAREFQVVEFRAKPGIGAVTGFAGRREPRSFVIRRDRPLEVGRVAGKAGGGEAGELARGLAFVAVHALEHRVGAEKWEAIRMLLQPLRLDAPSFYRVAILTFGAELPAMDIGVAIRTARADVGEDQTGVALRAAHFFMHPAERVTRAIVIKFGDAADWLPTRVRMAIFARDGDGAVRIASGFLVGLRLRDILPRNPESQDHEHESEDCRRAHDTLPPFCMGELG